ncbi:D-isomer specific 2-hydroxyacid dehydrogenase, putative, partial [Bodo saltans]
PATEENCHLFDEAVFKRMKRSAVYLNIGRGMTQREDHLAAALQTGTIRGAAVDVFEVEPLPAASPLWAVGDDKILLSPHNADITDEVFVETANFLQYVADGSLPDYCVDIHGKGYT